MKLNNTFPILFLLLHASFAFAKEIRIEWPLKKEATLYEVEVFSKKKESSIFDKKTKQNYILFDATKKKYYFRVRYFDQYGRWSPFSNFSKIKVITQNIPGEVQKDSSLQTSQTESPSTTPQDTPSTNSEIIQFSKIGTLISTNSFKSNINNLSHNFSGLSYGLTLSHRYNSYQYSGSIISSSASGIYKMTRIEIEFLRYFGNYFYFSISPRKENHSLNFDNNQFQVSTTFFPFKLGATLPFSENFSLDFYLLSKFGPPSETSAFSTKLSLNYSPKILDSRISIGGFASKTDMSFKSTDGRQLEIDEMSYGLNVDLKI